MNSIIDNIADQGQSIMEAFCENAQLFGATPGNDEFRFQGRLGRGRRSRRRPRRLQHPR